MTRDLDLPLQAGGTDPDAAEQALGELYRLAGLQPPAEYVWTESPAAAARCTRELLRERAAEVRRRASFRLAGSEGRVPCLCSWCRGVSAIDSLHRGKEAPLIHPDRLRLAEQTTLLIHRAIEQALGVPYPDSFHQLAYQGPGQRPSTVWPTNPWGVRFHTHTLGLDGRAGARREAERRDAWYLLACTAGWWFPYRGFAVLSARPVAAHHLNGRLHRADGPALEYVDGWTVDAIEGIEVDARYFDPGHPSVEDIVREPNLEVRRVLLDRFGHPRFIAEAGGRPLHIDGTGTLWEIGGMRMVEVVDATPRPDGTHRTYWLHVPPTTQTAREAVAWTFGLTAQQYRPEVET